MVIHALPPSDEYHYYDTWCKNRELKQVNAGRAGGSARVAKILAFASFGLQILVSDMSSLHELLCILLIMSCNVLLVCHELCKPHIILILTGL